MKFPGAHYIFTFLLFLGGSSIAKQLSATFDFCNFRATDSTGVFEYYLSFDGRSVHYVFSPEGYYQSNINVVVKVLDEDNVIFVDKYGVTSPPIYDTTEFGSEFLVQNRIKLPNGNYKFSLEAEDARNSKDDDPLSLMIPIEVGYTGLTLQISDVQTLKSFDKSDGTGPDDKSGFTLISRNSNYFAGADDFYNFYGEIYNSSKVLGDKEPFMAVFTVKHAQDLSVIEGAGSFAKFNADLVNPILGSIDLSKVPTGYYYFDVEVRNKENKSLASKRKFFRRVNPNMKEEEKEFDPNSIEAGCEIADVVDRRNLDYLLNGLMPMAIANENDFIDAVVASGTEEQKVKYLCYFFEKRATQERPALAQYLEFKDRLELAEKKYSTQTMPGYQTERGRVVIQYGKPNRIDDEFSDPTRQATNNAYMPYEIWTYYKVESPIPQTNIQFVFAQVSRANYNYVMVHSNAVGERSNPNWKQDIKARFIIDDDPADFAPPSQLNDPTNQ